MVAGFKLARIATDVAVAGEGLGGLLLVAAALRCLRIATGAGGVLLIIDAKSERAARWYESYGAEPLQGRPLMLVMPLATFAADLEAKGLLKVLQGRLRIGRESSRIWRSTLAKRRYRL